MGQLRQREIISGPDGRRLQIRLDAILLYQILLKSLVTPDIIKSITEDIPNGEASTFMKLEFPNQELYEVAIFSEKEKIFDNYFQL